MNPNLLEALSSITDAVEQRNDAETRLVHLVRAVTELLQGTNEEIDKLHDEVNDLRRRLDERQSTE